MLPILRQELTIKRLKNVEAPSLGQGYDVFLGESRLEPDDIKPKESLRLPENTIIASWEYSTMSEYSPPTLSESKVRCVDFPESFPVGTSPSQSDYDENIDLKERVRVFYLDTGMDTCFNSSKSLQSLHLKLYHITFSLPNYFSMEDPGWNRNCLSLLRVKLFLIWSCQLSAMVLHKRCWNDIHLT